MTNSNYRNHRSKNYPKRKPKPLHDSIPSFGNHTIYGGETDLRDRPRGPISDISDPEFTFNQSDRFTNTAQPRPTIGEALESAYHTLTNDAPPVDNDAIGRFLEGANRREEQMDTSEQPPTDIVGEHDAARGGAPTAGGSSWANSRPPTTEAFENRPMPPPDSRPIEPPDTPTPKQSSQAITETTPYQPTSQEPPPMPRLGLRDEEIGHWLEPGSDLHDMMEEMGHSLPAQERLAQIRRHLFRGDDDAANTSVPGQQGVSEGSDFLHPASGNDEYNWYGTRRRPPVPGDSDYRNPDYPGVPGDELPGEPHEGERNPTLDPGVDPDTAEGEEETGANAEAEFGLGDETLVYVEELANSALDLAFHGKHPVFSKKMATAAPPMGARDSGSANPNQGAPAEFPADLGAAEHSTHTFKKRHRCVMYNVSPSQAGRPFSVKHNTDLDLAIMGYAYAYGYYEIPDLHPAWYINALELQDLLKESTAHRWKSASWKIVSTDLQHFAETNPQADVPQQYSQNIPQPNVYILKKPSRKFHGRLRYWNTTVAEDQAGPPPQDLTTRMDNSNLKIADVFWSRDARVIKQLPIVDLIRSVTKNTQGLNTAGNSSNNSVPDVTYSYRFGIDQNGVGPQPDDWAGQEHEMKIDQLIGLTRTVKPFEGWRINHPNLISERDVLTTLADREYDINNPAGEYNAQTLVQNYTAPTSLPVNVTGNYQSRVVRPFTVQAANSTDPTWPSVYSAAQAHYNSLIAPDFSNIQSCRWENPYDAATYHINATSKQQHEPTFIRLDYLVPFGTYVPLSRLEMIIETTCTIEVRDCRWSRSQPLCLTVAGAGSAYGPVYNMANGFCLDKDIFYSPYISNILASGPSITRANLLMAPGCGAGTKGYEDYGAGNGNMQLSVPTNIITAADTQAPEPIEGEVLPAVPATQENQARKSKKRKLID